MKKRQESVESMMMRIKWQFGNAPTEVMTAIAGTLPAITAFGANVDLIRENEVIQSMDLSGYTEMKEADRLAMSNEAWDCAKRGKSYGLNNNLPSVVNELKKSKSWFKTATDLQVVTYSRGVYNTLLPLLSHLESYGVTSAKLTNLDTRITAFDEMINLPRENTSAKKRATENIVNLIIENTELLIPIDAGVDTVEETFPDFWRAYKSSRKLVDPGTHTRALKVNLSTEDGQAIGKVKVEIRKESFKLLKKTTAKGNFNVQNLEQGTYQMTCKKPGYLDLEMEINITDGERTELKLIMQLRSVPVLEE